MMNGTNKTPATDASHADTQIPTNGRLSVLAERLLSRIAGGEDMVVCLEVGEYEYQGGITPAEVAAAIGELRDRSLVTEWKCYGGTRKIRLSAFARQVRAAIPSV